MSRVTFVLAAAACLAVASPSLAADMYGGQPAAPAYGYATPVPNSPWNGVYAGGQIGHGWGPNGLNGAQVGIYGGINTTVGTNVVAGVEGDLNVSGQTATHLVGPDLYRYRSTWNATIRPRVGIAMDKVMPYATAGLAFADDDLKALGTSSDTTKVGYAVGAGVEAQVADHISVKGEYMHLGFGRTTHTVGGTTAASSSVNSNILRGGVAYHF